MIQTISSFRLKLSFCLLFHITFLVPASSPASQRVAVQPSEISKSLPQSTVTAILLDSLGLMWIGTQQGLLRYDGKNFIHFDDTSSSSISDSYISSVVEDHSGRILVGTSDAGLNLYDAVSNKFELIGHATDFAGGLKHQSISTMVATNDGVIWFGTNSGGLGAYSLSLDVFLPWISEIFNDYPDIYLYDLAADSSSRLWIATNSGVFYLDRNDASLHKLELGEQRLNAGRTTVLVPDKKMGAIWAINEYGTITKIDSSKSPPEFEVFFNKDLDQLLVSDGIFFKELIWLATDKGLLTIDEFGNTRSAITTDNSKISNDHIVSLATDIHSLWVGTYQGLDVLQGSPFERYDHNNIGVPVEVMSILTDRDSNTWVGTYNGLFMQPSGDIEHLPLEAIFHDAGLSDDRVMKLRLIRDEVWIGLRKEGVDVLDLKRGTIRKLEIPLLKGAGVTDIIEDRHGDIWISTLGEGLFFVSADRQKSTFKARKVQAQEIANSAIFQILPLESNQLLLVLENGIFALNQTGHQLAKLELVLPNSDKRFLPSLLSVKLGPDNQLWLATRNQGLFYAKNWNISTGILNFSDFEFNSKLPSKVVYSFEFDRFENLWVAGTKGLTRISLQDGTSNVFTEVEGLQGNEFNYGASELASNGKILFGGTNGYNRFDPADIQLDERASKVRLTKIDVAGRKAVTSQQARELEKLDIGYRDYFITFFFTIMEFQNPQLRSFKHKLKGFDEEWVEGGNNHFASYTNLPPGSYEFRVQGSNASGVWDRDGIKLALTVHSPPWRTSWAYSVYALMLLSLAFFMKKLYDGHVMKERAQQIALEMENTAESILDTLQDEIEYHGVLARTMQTHTRRLLRLTRLVLSRRTGLDTDVEPRLRQESDKDRILAFGQIERCTYERGALLFVSIWEFTNRAADQLRNRYPELSEDLLFTNSVTKQLFPDESATYIALAIYELLDNCFQHAFEDQQPPYYIGVELTKTGYDENDLPTWILAVSDSGIGMNDVQLGKKPKSAGYRIIRKLCKKLDAKLVIESPAHGSRIALIHEKEGQDLPSPDITTL